MSLFVDIQKNVGAFSLQVSFETGDETLALLGASGCGKSMTLRCIAGIEKPDRGRIVLDDVTLFDSRKRICLPPQRRHVGLMFQDYALFPQMTVEKNVECGARRSLKGEARSRAVAQALETMGISGLRDRLPSRLSGGERQRTALARILVNSPAILMLDEPFSALDSHLRFRMEQETRQVIRQFGKTVLLVTHDRDEVYRLADRVAIIEAGKIKRIGTRNEVFSDPGSRTGCILTGCKNVSSIRRIDDRHAYALDWGITLTLPLKKDTDALGIRMHSILPGDGENAFRCRVAEVIENPFSYTVMLSPVGAPPQARAVGWETEKPVWRAMEADEITVRFPAEMILQLKG